MDANTTKDIVLYAITNYSNEMFIIVGAVLTVIVGFFVLKIGLRAMKDESFQLGGYYLRKTPYKGYHRFRSKKWNIDHM